MLVVEYCTQGTRFHQPSLAVLLWSLQALPHGLLMNYPIFVTEDGAVGALPGAEDFCDLGGKILGTKSMLPGLLTS
jgi:hypothetical protein